MDTVPTDFSRWTKTEALKPKLIDGKIYGLGACDMKGGNNIICICFKDNS